MVGALDGMRAIVVGGGSRACKILVSPSVFDVLPGAEIVEDLAR